MDLPGKPLCLLGLALVMAACGSAPLAPQEDPGADVDAGAPPSTVADGGVAPPSTTVDGSVIVFGAGSADVQPDGVDVIWSGSQCNAVPTYLPSDSVYVTADGLEIDGLGTGSLTAAFGTNDMPVGTEIVFPDEPLKMLDWTTGPDGQTVVLDYGVMSSISYPNNGWLTVSWDQGPNDTPLIVGVPTVTFVSLPKQNEDVVRLWFHVNLVDGRHLDLEVAPKLPPAVYQTCGRAG
jgi:hypothetical protein